MGRLLRKITEVVPRITGSGATLNAMDELDRASRSLADLEAQLHRVDAPGHRASGHRASGHRASGHRASDHPVKGRRVKDGSSRRAA